MGAWIGRQGGGRGTPLCPHGSPGRHVGGDGFRPCAGGVRGRSQTRRGRRAPLVAASCPPLPFLKASPPGAQLADVTPTVTNCARVPAQAWTPSFPPPAD